MSTAAIIDRARTQGRKILTEVESKQLLEEAGIPTARARLATSRDAAVQAARDIGFPVVLKVVSPQISHKSDVGGVKLDLKSPEEVAAAFDEITAAARRAAPDATIDGVSVQQMARPGIEVIVGVSTDPQFGPVIMFGLGGVLVEVLKDVSFRIIPIAHARCPPDDPRDQGLPPAGGLPRPGPRRPGRPGEPSPARLRVRGAAAGGLRAGPQPHLRLQGRRPGGGRAHRPFLS